jgi:hypothetical protein|tara:strand:+ start:513 stop:710 length:198 start_codon:yes stop_codon:yes gene_type:complete
MQVVVEVDQVIQVELEVQLVVVVLAVEEQAQLQVQEQQDQLILAVEVVEQVEHPQVLLAVLVDLV